MRVWLVVERNESGNLALEVVLRKLENRAETGIRLVGVCSFESNFPESIRKLLPDLLDVLMVDECAWPDGPWTQELLSLGLGMLVVTPPEQLERFRSLVEQHPIGFLPPEPDSEAVWYALHSLAASLRRDQQWKNQVTRLEQRLSDRIVIERAKGILVHRLKISEEDAYKRLRHLSRRQRRQIRDIAQSLLDTQYLFSMDANGFATFLGEPASPEGNLPPPAE